MHLQPTSLRQRFGLLLALVLSLNFAFGLALTVDEVRTPLDRLPAEPNEALLRNAG